MNSPMRFHGRIPGFVFSSEVPIGSGSLNLDLSKSSCCFWSVWKWLRLPPNYVTFDRENDDEFMERYHEVPYFQSNPDVKSYPLVNIQKAIENGYLWCIFPLKMVIFYSYVRLPEGIYVHLVLFRLFIATAQLVTEDLGLAPSAALLLIDEGWRTNRDRACDWEISKLRNPCFLFQGNSSTNGRSWILMDFHGFSWAFPIICNNLGNFINTNEGLNELPFTCGIGTRPV